MNTSIDEYGQTDPESHDGQEINDNGQNELHGTEPGPFPIDDSTFNPDPKVGGLFSSTKIPLYLMIICLLLLALTIGMTVSMMRKPDDSWVYRIEVLDGLDFGSFLPQLFDVDKAVEEVGYSRWELCATVPLNETVFPNFGSEEYHTGVKSNTRTTQIILIFKRRI